MINEKLLLFCIIFICVKNLIISRLYAILNNKKPSIFLYNQNIIKQTLILWIISTLAELIGYISKYAFLYISDSSLCKNSNNVFSNFLSVLSINNPLIITFSFSISVVLCFLFVFILENKIPTKKRVLNALVYSILCSPCLLAFPIIDFSWTFTFVVSALYIVILLPYILFKHFSSLVYKINLKMDTNTVDNRIKCIKIAFVGELVGIITFLILGGTFNLGRFFYDPFYNETNIPITITFISIFIGFVAILTMLFRFCFMPKKNNLKKNIINVFALSILCAPYNLFLIFIVLFCQK